MVKVINSKNVELDQYKSETVQLQGQVSQLRQK